jgi:hypothetical protein
MKICEHKNVIKCIEEGINGTLVKLDTHSKKENLEYVITEYA